MGRVCITVNLLIDQNIILYLLSRTQIFAGTKFSQNLFLRLTVPKIANFAELIFANSPLVVKFAEFILAIGDQEEHFIADGQEKIQANIENKK